jgi:hypothetical protein
VATLALDDEVLQGDGSVLMAGRKLSDYLPERNRLIYTYDFGDTWVHEIELVRVIEDHNGISSYLLEASGQTPPEDVGGVDGFVEFREAILNKAHLDHDEMKEWAGS